MKLGGNLPPGHDALLFSVSGTGSVICPVAQTRLDMPRPLFTQSWTTGGSQSAPAQGRFEPPTCRSTVEHANHQTTMTASSQRIPGSSTGGGAIRVSSRVGSPQGTAEERNKASPLETYLRHIPLYGKSHILVCLYRRKSIS